MRLIDADALLDKTIKRNSIWNSITNSEGKNIEEIVSEIPTVQAVPIEVLQEIRWEIDGHCGDNRDRNDGLYIAMKIIDKYKAESEE